MVKIASKTPRQQPAERGDGSVDAREIEKFSALAAEWWDPQGSLAPLHRLNPLRLSFIRDCLLARCGGDAASLTPLAGLRLLDAGCGGGLLSEPLARLGATVTAIDAAPENIEVASLHAAAAGLAIDYQAVTAEALLATGQRFDAVVTMEVVEHVADVGGFVAALCGMLRPGGLLIAATLNRTPKSFLTAIVGAEYLLRWLPRGTHDWRRFLRPAELAGLLRSEGLEVQRLAGMVYNPLSDSWRLDPRDLSVNYAIAAAKGPAP